MKIVVMGGSFNPPTVAHLSLMKAALDQIGGDRGVFLPSSHLYVRTKMTKAGLGEEVFSENIRLEMLKAMTEDDDRLDVDDVEFHFTEKRYTYQTMTLLQEKYKEATLYFLVGTDKVEILPRWKYIREFLERFNIIICKRDGYDPREEIMKNQFLSSYAHRFYIMDGPNNIKCVSSSAVRAAILEGRLDVGERMMHPKSWKLLCDYKNAITEFSGEYRFLSNFYEAPVYYDGILYTSNEGAFQAQKCSCEEEKMIFAQISPAKAKSFGRKVALRPDWNEARISIMEQIVRAKFTQNEELKRLLLSTGDRLIEEGNTWNDTFWGVDVRTRKGKNHLGKILMKVRNELKSSENFHVSE